MDKIKLHLGCGSNKIKDYINLDIRESVCPDIIHDLHNPLPYKDNSVDEVYSRHVLEHFTRLEGMVIVTDWYRVLKPTGKVHIVVPNISFHANQLLENKQSTFSNQKEHAMAGFYGWETDSAGGVYARHLWGYTYLSLSTLLSNIGFCNIKKILKGHDTEEWHLNIEAFK